MTSSFTPRIRVNLQGTGDNNNTWGAILNSGVFQLVEDSVAKRLAFTLSGTKVLTTALGVADEARCAFLDVVSGTGGTVVTPAVEKLYMVRNGCSGDVVLSTGGGATATFRPGEIGWAACDAANWRRSLLYDFGGVRVTSLGAPTSNSDAATKKYVDDTAFNGAAAILPGQPGNANRFLSTNGAVAAWADPLPSQPTNAGKFLTTTGVDRTGAAWAFPLPNQTGAVGRFLTTDGSAVDGAASWGFAGFQGVDVKSGNYTVVGADREKLLRFGVSATLTLPLANPLLAAKFVVTVEAANAFVTVVRSGGDTIDGLTGYTIYPGEIRTFVVDTAATWISFVEQPFLIAVLGSGNVQWPPGYSFFNIDLWGAGGGGAKHSANPAGGGGGAYVNVRIPAGNVSPGASAAFVMGSGGAGATVNDTAGGGGGSSAFSGVTAYGGAGGQPTLGGGGGGAFSNGVGGNGGAPFFAGQTDNHFGGGGGGAGSPGARSVYGGGSGGSAVGQNGGSSLLGGSGGGAAGGLGGTSFVGAAGGNGGVGATPGGVGGVAGGGGGGGSVGNASNGGAGGDGYMRLLGVI